MCYYSDITAKNLTTEAKEEKDIEELSTANVVVYKSPLLPVRDAESQMSLGTYWIGVVDHKKLFI